MADPRCQKCTSLLRWTGRRYYCGKCKTFTDGVALGADEFGGVLQEIDRATSGVALDADGKGVGRG